MDSAEHSKVSEAIDTRLARLWAVYARIKGESFELSTLSLVHYVMAALPNVAFINLMVTDQGGDSMTFNHAGVAREKWDAWTEDRSYLGDPEAETLVGRRDNLETIDGVEYVLVDTTFDCFNTVEEDGTRLVDEDELWEHAAALEDEALAGWDFYERVGNRHSGIGRLWVDKALDALSKTYEGFIGEALDPMPDPNDKVALAAWLARATAPEETAS